MEKPTKAEARKAWKREYQKRWRAAHPEYNKEYCRKRYQVHGARYKGYGRKATLKRKYGISIEEYAAKLAEQGGVCAICQKPPKKYRLAVDHNHTTGKIRDLLCSHCNGRLWAIENKAFNQAALAYLEKHSG